MKGDYNKAVKWFFLMVLVVIGSWAFFTASYENDIMPVMLGVVSYGFVFIIGTMWKVFRDKVLLWTLALLIITSFATKYLPFYLFQYAEIYIDIHYVFLWLGLLIFPGIPIMARVFDKYDK